MLTKGKSTKEHHSDVTGEGVNSVMLYIVEHVHTKCTTGRFMYDGSYGEEGVTGQVILTNYDLFIGEE